MVKREVMITATLLDSYEFAEGAPPDWKVRAKRGLIEKVRREPVDYPDWVGHGVDFEKTVQRVCLTHERTKWVGDDKPLITEVGTPLFREVANACLGGAWSEWLNKEIEVDGIVCKFSGKTDVSFPDIIKDIKTTLNYKGMASYTKKWQCKLYPWMANVPKFEYLVAQWKDKTCKELVDVQIVPVEIDLDTIEQTITNGVQDLFNYLYKEDLWEDFFFTFSKNKR